MKGWKTWLAAGCTAGLGVVSILNGDMAAGLQQIVLALGMVGLENCCEEIPEGRRQVAPGCTGCRDCQQIRECK